jgi:hypothetical protein
MKNILFLLIFGLLLTSCKKDTITPGNYQAGTPPTNQPNNWQSNYGNGGVLPSWGNGSANNQLVGVNLLLTKVVVNFASTVKHDTIHFVSNTKYCVGSDTTKYNYLLYSTMGNSTLEFYQFNPINGLYLVCNNFNANVFTTMQVGGTVDLVFKDHFNQSVLYTTTFKKI